MGEAVPGPGRPWWCSAAVTRAYRSPGRLTTWPMWCWWSPRGHFVHNVAALRALVDPSWLEQEYYLPYTGLLGHGRVIRDPAMKADADRVVLASGAELFPDYLVLATGSGYPFPAKSDLPGTEAAHGKVRGAPAWHSRRQTGCCCSTGAGPVGIELAGEIKAVWPGKQVTLVDMASDVLGERCRPDLKAELRRQLTGLGTELLLGSPLWPSRRPRPVVPGTFTVTTQAGTRGDRRHLVPLPRRRPGQRLPGRWPGHRAPPGRLRRGDAGAAGRRAGKGVRARRCVGRGCGQRGRRGWPSGTQSVTGNIRALITGATVSWRATNHRQRALSCRSAPTAVPGSGRTAPNW